MAKTLIIEEYETGEKQYLNIPAASADAVAFCTPLLLSQFTPFSLVSSSGQITDTAKKAVIWIQQLAADGSVSGTGGFSVLVKPTTSETEIQAALQGLTIRGCKADNVGCRIVTLV